MTRMGADRELISWSKVLTAVLRRHTLLAIWLVVAIGVRVAFWALTDRTWEDALITVANARNAVEGVGLTNHPGDGIVHSFTSAASVLIPLIGELLNHGWGLNAVRIASLLATVASIAYGYAIARRLGLGAWTTSFALGYLALNLHHVFYGMAGMETQVAVAVVLAGTYHVLAGHHLRSGLAGGLAILARPDLILFAVPVLLWAATSGGRPLLRTGAATAVVVLPWVIFTTLYYGSPVPHSIPAKALIWSPLRSMGESTAEAVRVLGQQASTGFANAVRGFTPFYEDTFVISAPLPLSIGLAIGATMLVLTVVGAWTTRRVPRWWPAVSFVALFAVYRALLLPASYFDWYLPPFTALCALLIAAALQRASLRTPMFARGLVVVLLVGVAVHLPFTFALESRIQREVEDGVRRPVGQYLHEVMTPDEEFMAESAGYFGFYSRRTIWDQPGLTSPTSYAATRTLPQEDRRVEGLLNALRPDWAVLRPMEWSRLERDFPEAAACYSPTRSFGIPGRDRIGWGGLEKLTLDWSYTVYQRDACDQIAE
jgi:hypothetical protein